MEKPTLPKGTRDFGPQTMAKRQFIFNTIRGVFQKFGFQPLETPAMENLSTLTGKYGDEGDQLLFKVLDSGEYFEKAKKELTDHYADEKVILEYSKNCVEIYEDALTHLSFRTDPRSSLTTSFFSNLYDSFQKSLLVMLNTQWKFNTSKEFYISLTKHKSPEIFSKISSITTTPEDSADTTRVASQLYSLIQSWVISQSNSKDLVKLITEKGLRYDLTVPFARYVVMNRNEVSFPFKRYQIQPVWRADRPQKGRYREFYQCDADVVGTDSLVCEAEIVLMIKETFAKLGITDYSIKINHRGILNGVAEVIGAKGNETSLFVAIDKLDKIGDDGVKQELRAKGFQEESLTKLFEILHLSGSNTNKISFLTNKFDTIQEGQKGLRDLREVFNMLHDCNATQDHVDFDVTLARGLSYYTGCIFEVKINNVAIGSVSGGGRYDNLTQSFGDKDNLSGVGFSFGVDRIYDAMEELKLFPKDAQISSKVLVCHFDEESMRYGLKALTKLRAANIAAEIYPDLVKIKKQLDYGNKKMIPYTIVIGSDEMNSGLLAFKNMETGVQEKLTIEEIVAKIGIGY